MTFWQSITHAIYHLAERPELLQPLREEIEPLVNEEGWTKNAMGKMWKLDSVFRESSRYHGIVMSALRPHFQPYRFSLNAFSSFQRRLLGRQ